MRDAHGPDRKVVGVQAPTKGQRPCASQLHSTACSPSPVPPCARSGSSRRRSPSPSPCAAAGSCALTAPTRPRPATTPAPWTHAGGTWTLAACGWSSRPGCAALPAHSMGCAPSRCRSPGRSRGSPVTSRTWWRGWPPGWTSPRSGGWSGSPGRRWGRSVSGWWPTNWTRAASTSCSRSAWTRSPGARATATSPWSPTTAPGAWSGARKARTPPPWTGSSPTSAPTVPPSWPPSPPTWDPPS